MIQKKVNMDVGGDFNYQQGKNISYKKEGGDSWLKILVLAVVSGVIVGGILYYFGWI